MTGAGPGAMDGIHASFDYGYDPDAVEACPIVIPPPPDRLPARATVDPAWLPPVGTQTTPSGFVWASIYGLATYKAARTARRAPFEPALQASPFYPYIKILEQFGARPGACTGGLISWCLDFLRANDGTPTLEQAPAPVPKPGDSDCQAVWRAYGGALLVSDYAFSIGGCGQVGITGKDGLDALRGLIARGLPLACGTSLHTDFPAYGRGGPVPYAGNGRLLTRPDGRRAGQCLMILGYDDALGAVLLRNSFGPGWGTEWAGSGGHMWMAYDTFQALAQGSACFIHET
ncbi:MAG TPA: hypothetical protein VIQ53_26615 [Inquilinus sp.]